MTKKIILNIVLLFTTYVLPLYVFYEYQNNYSNVKIRQNIIFLSLLFGSILLIYLNNKHRKQVIKYKFLWISFEIVGVLGFCYSLSVLWLLFMFRNCCGF